MDKPKLPKPWIAIRDHVGLVFVAVALGLCLRVVGVPWWPVLAWFAVSGAVIYVIGAGRGKRFLREEESRGLVSRLLQMYGDAPEAETVKAELEEARLESKRLGRDVSQQLIGVALLVASAFGMALAVHGGAAPLREPNQMTVRFSGGTEEHPVVDPQKQPPSGPNETILRLDPGLERDISAYFRMPRSEGGSGLSSRGLFFVVALLILAEVIVLGWALKHRPSAVPLIGAADLAALVIKNADHLSRPGGGWFWGTVYIFLGIALFLLVAGVRQVLVPKAPAASTPGPIEKKKTFLDWLKGWLEGEHEEAKEESLLSIGVSALILVWSLLLLAQAPKVQVGPEHTQNTEPTSPPPTIGNVVPLTGPKFEPAMSDTSGAKASDVTKKGIDDLKKELAERAKEGDVVLLIGSTDCTSFKNGNYKLANERATNVSDSLQNVVPGVEIQIPRPLPQHNNCKGSEDLRAVHPFLIPLKRDGK